MWPFRNSRKRASQRRANGRRAGAGSAPTLWQRFRRSGGVGSVLFAAALLAAALVMDTWPLEPLPYRQGGYLGRDVFARVTFQVESPARTKHMRDAAARQTPATIFLDGHVLDRMLGQLQSLPGRLKAVTQPALLDEGLRKRFNLATRQDLAGFAKFAAGPAAATYKAQLDRLREALLAMYILTGADYSRAYHLKETDQVRVVEAARAEIHPKSRLISLVNSPAVGAFLTSAVAPIDPSVRGSVLHYLQQSFAAGTTVYRLDASATQAAEEAAREAVPPASEPVPARRLLARTNPKRGLPEADLALLSAEHAAYVREQNAGQPWRRFWIFLGRAGMIAAVVVLLCLYVYRYQPSVAKNPLQGFAVVLVLGLMLLLTKIMLGAGGWNPHLAAFCVFTAGAILAIAFDQRFAFAVTGALVVLTALQLRAGLGELVVLCLAAGVAVFQLREVRARSKLIQAGAIAAAAVFAGTWAVGAAAGVPARFILVNSSHAAAAAVAGGFLTQGLLPLIERVFRVATSLTLLEWCDANRPLLKRVALEAPGTYSHSLMLGTMCEAAADAIDANGLLARVGAYYHDIGKINKPDYFVENQSGPGSKHDKLSPAMSLLIIKGHVKEGLEMAREYSLPPVLHDFITTHHGSTLVEYFYHAAAQQRKEEVDRAPDEVEFRYPGPKPRLKEAAILMLADASESAVRAMTEPTPGRIETQVHQIIYKRLMDGQLDECEMTLKQVHAIETSLVKSLCGIHHARVQYPSQKKEFPAEQETPAPSRNGGHPGQTPPSGESPQTVEEKGES